MHSVLNFQNFKAEEKIKVPVCRFQNSTNNTNKKQNLRSRLPHWKIVCPRSVARIVTLLNGVDTSCVDVDFTLARCVGEITRPIERLAPGKKSERSGWGHRVSPDVLAPCSRAWTFWSYSVSVKFHSIKRRNIAEVSTTGMVSRIR